MRTTARAVLTGALTGVLSVGAAYAGMGLTPVATTGDAVTERAAAIVGDARVAADPAARAAGTPVVEAAASAVGTGASASQRPDESGLKPDEALVGAARVSLEPKPDASKGEVWTRDKKKCLPAGASSFDPAAAVTHAGDTSRPWVENPTCLYMGGFGLGPSQPITSFDQVYGLYARSVAVTKGGQTLVTTLLDAEGYNGIYSSMCPADLTCGANDIAKEMGAELGISPTGIVIASTHAHSAMDLIGGWGGVPKWYMKQVSLAIRSSIRQAVAEAVPATVEAGDTLARKGNSERRGTYHSADDPTLNWLRAVDRSKKVVATWGTFAAHPTSFGGSVEQANADWNGQFSKAVTDRFGGEALAFPAGLGNESARGNDKGSMGQYLASVLPPVGSGTPVTNPVVRVAQGEWLQPATNLPLSTLGAGNFFDRPFEKTPAAVNVAVKSAAYPCRSASPVSVRVRATAAKIGGVAVVTAPGEIFANFSNSGEERFSDITTLSIGQAGDALGYMPQSFETRDDSRQGGGFVGGHDAVGGDVFEYEDAYSIDRCFGDMAFKTQQDLLAGLK